MKTEKEHEASNNLISKIKTKFPRYSEGKPVNKPTDKARELAKLIVQYPVEQINTYLQTNPLELDTKATVNEALKKEHYEQVRPLLNYSQKERQYGGDPGLRISSPASLSPNGPQLLFETITKKQKKIPVKVASKLGETLYCPTTNFEIPPNNTRAYKKTIHKLLLSKSGRTILTGMMKSEGSANSSFEFCTAAMYGLAEKGFVDELKHWLQTKRFQNCKQKSLEKPKPYLSYTAWVAVIGAQNNQTHIVQIVFEQESIEYCSLIPQLIKADIAPETLIQLHRGVRKTNALVKPAPNEAQAIYQALYDTHPRLIRCEKAEKMRTVLCDTIDADPKYAAAVYEKIKKQKRSGDGALKRWLEKQVDESIRATWQI